MVGPLIQNLIVGKVVHLGVGPPHIVGGMVLSDIFIVFGLADSVRGPLIEAGVDLPTVGLHLFDV